MRQQRLFKAAKGIGTNGRWLEEASWQYAVDKREVQAETGTGSEAQIGFKWREAMESYFDSTLARSQSHLDLQEIS